MNVFLIEKTGLGENFIAFNFFICINKDILIKKKLAEKLFLCTKFLWKKKVFGRTHIYMAVLDHPQISLKMHFARSTRSTHF